MSMMSHQKFDPFFLFNFVRKKSSQQPSQARKPSQKNQAKPETKPSQKPSQEKKHAKQNTEPSHQHFFGFQAKPQKFAGLPRSGLLQIMRFQIEAPF
jgi:hypothetical protein